MLLIRSGDVWLFEDQPPKTRVDESILSATLSVVVQFWNYAALSTARYPAGAIGQISGTGVRLEWRDQEPVLVDEESGHTLV